MTGLPYYRAYKSVHGGSIASVQRLLQVKDTAISCLCESFAHNVLVRMLLFLLYSEFSVISHLYHVIFIDSNAVFYISPEPEADDH